MYYVVCYVVLCCVLLYVENNHRGVNGSSYGEARIQYTRTTLSSSFNITTIVMTPSDSNTPYGDSIGMLVTVANVGVVGSLAGNFTYSYTLIYIYLYTFLYIINIYIQHIAKCHRLC